MDGVGKSASPDAPAGAVTPGRRETQRARVRLAATLVGTTRDYPVTVRNISCTGAMVEGAELPPAGRTVALKRAGMDELGDVVWTGGSLCGLHFFEPLPYSKVLEIAALPPEARQAQSPSLYVAPAGRDDRLSAEDWARSKLRASRMQL